MVAVVVILLEFNNKFEGVAADVFGSGGDDAAGLARVVEDVGLGVVIAER